MKSLPAEFLAWGPWLVLCRSRLLQDVVGGGRCGQQHPQPGRGSRKLPMAATVGGPTSLSYPLTPTILDAREEICDTMWFSLPCSPVPYGSDKPKLTPPRDCWPPQGTPSHICPLPITTHPPCAKILRLPAKMTWMRAPTTVLMCKTAAGARRHRVCPESPTQKYKVAP